MNAMDQTISNSSQHTGIREEVVLETEYSNTGGSRWYAAVEMAGWIIGSYLRGKPIDEYTLEQSHGSWRVKDDVQLAQFDDKDPLFWFIGIAAPIALGLMEWNGKVSYGLEYIYITAQEWLDRVCKNENALAEFMADPYDLGSTGNESEIECALTWMVARALRFLRAGNYLVALDAIARHFLTSTQIDTDTLEEILRSTAETQSIVKLHVREK